MQATAAGLGVALSGALRDLVNALTAADSATAAASANGYLTVYSLEIVLLLVTAVVIAPLIKRRVSPPSPPGDGKQASALRA